MLVSSLKSSSLPNNNSVQYFALPSISNILVETLSNAQDLTNNILGENVNNNANNTFNNIASGSFNTITN